MSYPPISLAEQLKELRRELAQREHLYPRWIGEGKLTKAVADHRMACLVNTIAAVESLAEALRKRIELTFFDD
jgi:hypothetical protein